MAGCNRAGKGVNFPVVSFALDLTRQVKNVCDIHKQDSSYCLEPGKMNNTGAEIETEIRSYS